MNIYKGWDKYPTIANQNIAIKNIALLIILLLIGLFMYYQFYSKGISAFSNTIRFILYIIFAAFGFYNLNTMAVETVLEVDEESIATAGGSKLFFDDIYGFDIVDLGDYLEYIFLTNAFTGQFRYFYISRDDDKVPELTKLLLTNIQFIEELNNRDFFHRVSRKLRIK
jgi:hypothetical protein